MQKGLLINTSKFSETTLTNTSVIPSNKGEDVLPIDSSLADTHNSGPNREEVLGNMARDNLLACELHKEITDRKTNSARYVYIDQNTSTGVVTVSLKNVDNTVISSGYFSASSSHTIVKAELDIETEKIIFTRDDGSTMECDISDLIDDYESKILTEKTRASAAENTLNTAITGETQARTAADTTLQTNINNEATRAENAEDSLNTNKVNKTTTIAGVDLQDNITKAEMQQALDIEEGAQKNVQPDWAETDTTADDYIKNKPTTVAGYGITDAYTKQETDAKVSTHNADANAHSSIRQSVTDEATSRSNADNALSNRIDALEGRGRYLSGWDCSTGLPTDYPIIPTGATSPYVYTYKSGDYYTVSNVPTSGTKYMPAGSSITATKVGDVWTWTIGKTTTTDEIFVNDDFRYSSSSWGLFHTQVNVLDTSVKLSSQLKTYYNIGKIQNASGTNPVVIGNAGDTIRDVLNNLTQMDESQPVIVSSPSISSLSISSNASAEYGTVINTVSYSLSTTTGSYTYAPNPTGVTWSNSFTFSGASTTTGTGISGTLTLTSSYTVGVSSALSFTCSGTHSAGGIAKTNLGNDSNPVVQIAAGTKTKTASFSKTAQYFTYYKVTNTSGAPGSTGWTAVGSASIADITISANAGQFIWIATTQNKTAIYEWNDVSGKYNTDPTATTKTSGQTIHTTPGVDVNTYYFYRTTNARSGATNKKFKLA